MTIFDRIRLAYNTGVRFTAFRIIARILHPEYRLRYNLMDWLTDRNFNDYLAMIGEFRGINSGRRFMVYQLLRATAAVPGDTAECGAYRGAGSFIMCAFNEAAAPQRTHHVFDSFAGLSKPVLVDGKHWSEADLAVDLETVKTMLSRFTKVLYHPGWIPNRFHDVAGRQFSFVHIDVDIYEPTKASIEFFYPRLSPGGILICDDWGFSNCPGATKAIDDFLADKPEKMIAMSDGGGFIIKGTAVAPLYSLPVEQAARPVASD